MADPRPPRIAVLTGGGDAPGLNAAVRALTLGLSGRLQAEVLGVEDGCSGLLEDRMRPLRAQDVDGISGLPGTVLGTSNRVDPRRHEGRDRRAEIVQACRARGLDGLVAIGGEGTLAIAASLHAAGLPCIGLPKTIDNDVPRVERSIGHDTAVAAATDALDRLRATAASHGRVMLLETMGRDAGWIALAAGVAAGADLVLVPERPHRLPEVAAACRRRLAERGHVVVCVAEGAQAQQALPQAAAGGARLGGTAERLARALEPMLEGHEARATALGHLQRGAPPVASDRLLAALLAHAAVDRVRDRAWGSLVTLCDARAVSLPLACVQGSRRVPDAHPLFRAALDLGVGFGTA